MMPMIVTLAGVALSRVGHFDRDRREDLVASFQTFKPEQAWVGRRNYCSLGMTEASITATFGSRLQCANDVCVRRVALGPLLELELARR